MSRFSISNLANIYKEKNLEIIESIKTDLNNNQNVFLYHEPYQPLKELITTLQLSLNTSRIVLYFDLGKVFNLKSMLIYMVKECLKAQNPRLKEIFDFSSKYMPNFRPEIVAKNMGKPDIMINYALNDKVLLGFIKDLIDSFEKIAIDNQTKISVIFNNYDNILNINKRTVEEVLRNKIATQSHINYLFICSNEDAVAKIFTKKFANKYQIKSSYLIPLLAKSDLINLLSPLSIDSASTEIINTYCENPLNIFLLAKTLEHNNISIINRITIKEALDSILDQMNPVYSVIWDDLSTHQKILLNSIATNGGEQIFSYKFIAQNDLGSAPSVQTSVNALLKRNILHKNNKEFHIIDKFFKQWVIQQL